MGKLGRQSRGRADDYLNEITVSQSRAARTKSFVQLNEDGMSYAGKAGTV